MIAHRWHMIGPQADKIIAVAALICVAPIFFYNIMNIALRPFTYAATSQYPNMEFFSWLRMPCGDHSGIGYKSSYRDGIERVHVMVCLTADGWAVIQTDKDRSTPSRPSGSP